MSANIVHKPLSGNNKLQLLIFGNIRRNDDLDLVVGEATSLIHNCL